MSIKLICKIPILLTFIVISFSSITLAESDLDSQHSQINKNTTNSGNKAQLADYLSRIKSIAVEFIQTDTKGQSANGMLIIDKPYKFRCNYYDPFPLLIVGNKNYVSVYDYELKHFSRIKSEENIFNFLLLDQVDFEKDFEILYEQETGGKNDGQIELMLYHEDSGRNSKITFDKSKKQLKSIQIFEDDNEIMISFKDTRNIQQANRKLFILQDPDIFGVPKRWNKQELEKMVEF